MATIDGDQLRIVQKILGISQTGLSGLTEIDDGSLTQVLNISPEMLRRGLAPVASDGWYTCVLENVHAAAGEIRSAIDPYTPGDAAAGGYPSPVPDDLDFWLLACGCALSAGADLFLAGMLNVVTPATAIGWALDDGDVVVAPPIAIHQIGRWDDMDATQPAALAPCFLTASGQTTYWPRMRIRRGGTINFETEQTGSGDMELRCFMICGLFPASLGQDVTV